MISLQSWKLIRLINSFDYFMPPPHPLYNVDFCTSNHHINNAYNNIVAGGGGGIHYGIYIFSVYMK